MIVRGAVLREMGLPAPYAESRPLRVEEVELAPPGPGELLVQIRAAGLCHSDLSVIDGSRPRVMPMLLGHEATGEVVVSNAPGFAPGDVIACAFVPACGTCAPCADGRPALCEPGATANTAGTLLSGSRRLTTPTTTISTPTDGTAGTDQPPAAASSDTTLSASSIARPASGNPSGGTTPTTPTTGTDRTPGDAASRTTLAAGIDRSASGTLSGGTASSGTASSGGVGPAYIHHHLGVSGFAEHAVVSARSAVKIDPALPPEIAALFGCAVMTGVGAVVNTAQVRAGRSTAIFGLGGVGLSALLGAVLAGAHPIVAVDVVPSKLALARSLGATAVVDARDADAVEQVREATAGGAEYAFETVGSAKVLEQAYAATHRGGTTVTVGLPHPSQSFSVPAVSLVAEERTVKGSYLGSSVPSRDIPRYVALYQAGRLPVDRLLTATVGLDDLNQAFDELVAGTSIRQVLLF